MRIVYALGGHPDTQLTNYHILIKSILVSFFYKGLLRCVSLWPEIDYLLLDSGAFSAWSTGAEIDVKQYADWLDFVKATHGKNIKRIEAVNLDVITNANDSKTELSKAYTKSMENLYYLKSRGHNVLPVHHQFEPYSILEDYAKDFKFICISPNNREHTNSKRDYLDGCFKRIKGSVAAHGLAVTAEPLIVRYPWFSVDSSIVQTPYRYGRIGLRNKNKIGTTQAQGANRNLAYLRRLAHETIKHLTEMEDLGTNFWKRKGITWEV